jgi:ABC-2 type transport system ATP-binding protein
MTSTGEQFSYTGSKGSFLKAISPFLILVLMEGGLGLLLILLLVKSPLRPGLAIAWCALMLIPVLGVLLRPFWTRHRLTPSTLELRYGANRLDVPREAIVAARPVAERLAHQRLRIDHDPRRERLIACFSEAGQILLELDEPRELGGRLRYRGPVRQVLINVDRPDDLLAALDVSRPAPPAEAPALALPRAAPRPPGAGGTAIAARGLTRRYGSKLAVDHLDLQVAHGEIYGFLGPNGAGKTTTIKMLVGLLEPHAGTVALDGHDVWADSLAAKAAFGYVPDRAHLYEQLTGREFLEFIAQMRALPRAGAEARIEELLALLQLEPAADALCGTYSFGMKRKLALAAALLHRPRVLILDEPFNGLDPRSSRRLKDLLVQLADEGCGLLMSTHDLATAEAVCHRLGVLHHGRLVAEGRNAEELRELDSAEGGLEAVFLQLTEEGE